MDNVIAFIGVCSCGGDEQLDNIRELNLSLYMTEHALRFPAGSWDFWTIGTRRWQGNGRLYPASPPPAHPGDISGSHFS